MTEWIGQEKRLSHRLTVTTKTIAYLSNETIVYQTVDLCVPTFVCFAVICCSKQKKGIKSSIGRLFGKKEKGRLDQTMGRDGQPLPALSGAYGCPILM